MNLTTVSIFFLSAGLALAQTSTNPVSIPSGILNYQPITGEGRAKWFVSSTVGPTGLAGVAVSAGWDTIFNSPTEYGPHWEGFGKRYGVRMATSAVGNAVEVSAGAIWGEDPRYVRAPGQPFKKRVGQVVKMTFVAPNRQGRLMPAYARYAAISGSNFLSNTWRADSEATVGDASLRTVLGFAGRMASNAFEEFWPDVRQRLFRKKH